MRLRPGRKLGGKFHVGQVQLRPILACPFDHPKCQDEKKKMKKKEEKKKRKGGTVNIVRVSVKASPAEGRRRLHTNTAHARLSGFHVEHRRRKAGDAPHEGLLKVERWWRI